MCEYFRTQWIENPRRNNWQMYHVPAGYPNTNNFIELFHKQIEQVFTNSVCLTVLQLLKCLTLKLVNYFSVEMTDFKYYRSPECQMIQKAKLLSSSNFFQDKLNTNGYYYNKPDSNVQYIITVFQNTVYRDYNWLSFS